MMDNFDEIGLTNNKIQALATQQSEIIKKLERDYDNVKQKLETVTVLGLLDSKKLQTLTAQTLLDTKKLLQINKMTLHAGCMGNPDCFNCKIQKVVSATK